MYTEEFSAPAARGAFGVLFCLTKNGGTLTFFKEAGDQANFGQVRGTNAIPSATTNAAIGN